MEFPDFGLVQLSPRDLTGPGVEFFARRLAVGFATQAGSIVLPADQTSFERLYLLNWAFSLIPDAAPSPAVAKGARIYLQYPAIDVQLYGWSGQGYAGTANQRQDDNSPFFVIPGGKPLLFVAEFSAVAAAQHSLDSWLWGYSFPKGNVLSF